MSPPTSPTRPRQCHLTPALAFLCLSLAACETPSLLTIFTALAYTSDGQALVLEATDGIYLASPPDSTPERLGDLEQGCEGDWRYSLGLAITADIFLTFHQCLFKCSLCTNIVKTRILRMRMPTFPP